MPESPLGHLVLVLHSHLPWVLGHGKWPHGEDWLYEAVSESYVPVIQTLDRLATEGASPRVTIGVTPVLAEMLASPRFREGFVGFLDARIALAERDAKEFEDLGEPAAARLAAMWSEFYRGVKDAFLTTYGGDLLGVLRRLERAGHIEVITSAATHGYLPLIGREESVEAQVRVGVATHRRHFKAAPRGIWLPECGYRPAGEWSRPVGTAGASRRAGLEEVVARNGLRYFFVDTHLVAGGTPRGPYDDDFGDRAPAPARPSTGLTPNEAYAVVAGPSRRRVAVLARDPRSSVQVWSADYGYPGDGAYLEFHRKKGRDGLRYWRVTDRRLPLDDKRPYDLEAAAARARAHAEHFVGVVRETLRTHLEATGRPGVVVAPFDTELFGHWWFEGTRWLEAVIRGLGGDVLPATASEALLRQPPRTVVSLPEGSWGQGGGHWVWLNDDTKWVWALVYEAEDAFMGLMREAPRPPRGVAGRVFAQLARELLLLESSDWPFLITTVSARDYAEARAKLHRAAFDRLLGMARKANAGPLPPEDEAWLSEVEARDAPFPEIDLRSWTEA
ncbi:MAG: hypothetical protein A3K65_03830 [Euryarchaeota archaeon RBG_16_68_12]|nr:MAG: hypothetical protein A3K65_03830 [Euryarchaeota archaeon RBG_16_68_12]